MDHIALEKSGQTPAVRQTARHTVPTQIKNPALVQKRRRRIVDSTVHLFAAHGYHRVTTRMIAKASGLSIGSLYEYVGSKEDVLYLVCEAICPEVEKGVEKALALEEPGREQETLAEMIRQYILVCDRMNDHILLMYQITQFLPKPWQVRVLENELRITDNFIRVLKRLSGKNGFPELSGQTLNLIGHNIAVLGQMWAFRRWYLTRHFTVEDYIQQQSILILRLIFGAENQMCSVCTRPDIQAAAARG
ncbi:MAG: TetR/AcrR family transcriptional regulator [Pseudomonadota bacterium]